MQTLTHVPRCPARHDMPSVPPHELRMPELGIPGPARLSVWLVEDGSEVTEGDRLVEVLAGNATVDLPAPASGVLRQTVRGEDEPVVIGQVLGFIEAVTASEVE